VWLAADKAFFPLCVPAVDRGELGATLTGIQVQRLDERPALAELLHRVSDHLGRPYSAPAADEQITLFTSILPTRLAKLAAPATVPAAELEDARTTIATLGDRLTQARDEVSQERARADDILAAKTLDVAKERAREVHGDTKQELAALVEAARAAVRKVPGPLADALPYELRGARCRRRWAPPGSCRRSSRASTSTRRSGLRASTACLRTSARAGAFRELLR
jgi:hypothetical protein